LGRPGGPLLGAADVDGWRMFVAPWASPMMWLFLAGFVMAHGCMKTGLDRWMAALLLGRLSGGIGGVLGGVLGLTFLLSMFMSNTATAAMMLAVVAGVTRGWPAGDMRAKALYIGVPVAANLGGMGTLIGTPPNAIAAGVLAGDSEVGFFGWMLLGLPPALFLLGVAFLFLWWRFLRGRGGGRVVLEGGVGVVASGWQRFLVMGVFSVTVVLWMTEALHGIPTPVVSFLPIVALAVTGVVGSADVRELPWDVLLLLAGGLSLGVGVEASGLAGWVVGQVPAGMGIIALLLVMVGIAVTLSNLMSNTAAASLLVPLGAGLAGSHPAGLVVIPIALACSAAMALPISTPPNALAYASGRLASRDFLGIGLLLGIVGPVVFVCWSWWMMGR
jgi:sodium-dependent dicarboxylate transporter 2/3/5